jgi:hypothetical protein
MCIFIALTFILLNGNLYGQTGQAAKYDIAFTKIPGAGGGPAITKIISGKATGPDLSSFYIVIYAKAGGKWWVQPITDNPYTKITSGIWQNETHLGIEYAALLVKKSYKPSNTLITLPQTDNLVLAIKIVEASK